MYIKHNSSTLYLSGQVTIPPNTTARDVLYIHMQPHFNFDHKEAPEMIAEIQAFMDDQDAKDTLITYNGRYISSYSGAKRFQLLKS